MPPNDLPDELAGEFVVIARHEHHPGAVPHLAQQLLNDVVVRLRPIPGGSQSPAVDDVADQVDRIRVVVAQKIENQGGLTSAGAQMHVGNEDRAVASSGVQGLGHGRLDRSEGTDVP